MNISCFTAGLLPALFLTIAAAAQSDRPQVPFRGASAAAFVPAGWQQIAQATGDLNKDGLEDRALIIENTSRDNFIANEQGLGGDTLNLNPRMLLVLFREQGKGYKLVEENTAFIPRPDDAESSCLADPLGETEKVTIRKGLLGLHFQYWYSCGSWYTSNHDYLFRFQNGRFELIGFDTDEMHRASGERSHYSVNFSTGKYSHTSGGNEFEDNGKKQETKWGVLKAPRKLTLRTMDLQSFEGIYKMIGIL